MKVPALVPDAHGQAVGPFSAPRFIGTYRGTQHQKGDGELRIRTGRAAPVCEPPRNSPAASAVDDRLSIEL